MGTDAIVILSAALLAAGGILAARAGIRSIQRARTVIFYRTRKAYTLVGWQWLLLALVLFSSTVASALFGEPVASQFLPQTAIPVDLPVATAPLPSPTLVPSATQTKQPSATPTPNGTITQTLTP